MANGNNPNPKKTTSSTPKTTKKATTSKTTGAGTTKKRASTTATTTKKKSTAKPDPEATALKSEPVEKASDNNVSVALQLFEPYGGLKKVGGQFAFEVLPGEEPQMFRDATEAIAWFRDNRIDLNEMLASEGLEVPILTQQEEEWIEAVITEALQPSPDFVVSTNKVDETDNNPVPVADNSFVSPTLTEADRGAEEIAEQDAEELEDLVNLTAGMDGMTGEERKRAIALMKAPLSTLIFGSVNTETATGVYNHEYTQQELAEYLGIEPTVSLGALMVAVAKKGHGLQRVGSKYKITA